MARMIPDLNGEQLRALRSRGESRFYEACRDQLPANFVVIYGASWIYKDNSGRLREGEADFTVLHPNFGVLAVEVKGGGVSHDASKDCWHSIDRQGRWHVIKDPFKQASGERHSLLHQISGHRSWRQWPGTRLTLGHAVVFPDLTDSSPLQSSERPKEIIGVNSSLVDVRRWLESVFRFWKSAGDDELGARGVRLIEDILCKSIEVKPVLRSTIDDAEQQRLRLTSDQAKVLRIIGGRRKAVISGGAGTGKTVIAVSKARALAEMSLNVLLLCYNRPLADSISLGLRDVPNIHVMSFHQLCDRRIRKAYSGTKRNCLDEAKSAYPGESDKHYFDVQMPYALALANEIVEERYDAIVIDEAQDFSDEYWFAIEELLKDPDHGYLYIFIDENQALYKRHGNLPVSDSAYYLTSNCRNTIPIHKAGYAYYSGEPVDPPNLVGPAIEKVSADRATHQAEQVITRALHLIKHEALNPEDVVILVARRPKVDSYELLKAHAEKASLPHVFEQEGKRGGNVLVDTVSRFKGLEAQAVILWLGEEVVLDKQWETIYVGITRAKSLLTVVGTKSTLASLFGTSRS